MPKLPLFPQIELSLKPKVILDASVVEQYVFHRNKENQSPKQSNKNVSIISLSDSDEKEEVVFISEEAASREQLFMSKMNKKICKLEEKNRELQQALKAIKNVHGSSNKNESQPSTSACEPSGESSLNMSMLSESWMQGQVEDLIQNGNYSAVLNEVELYLNNS